METVGLIFSFAVIMKLSAMRFNLALTLVIGSIIIAVSAGMRANMILAVAYSNVFNPATLSLAGAVMSLHLLGFLMKRSGLLENMVTDLRNIINDQRILTALLPMVIGMLVVPGGAIMSAPMVEKSGEKAGIDRASMAAVNILFRHLWYFIYPIYPLFIMVSDLSGIIPSRLIGYLALPTLVGLSLSAWVCFRGTRKPAAAKKRITPNLLAAVIKDISPILIIFIFRYAVGLPFLASIFIGLLLAGYYLHIQVNYNNPFHFVREIVSHINWKLGLIVVAVMLLRGYVIESGSVNILVEAMSTAGLPLLILAVVVPFAIGLLTASNYTSVGIAFAVFGPIISNMDASAAYYSLIFITAVTGYFLSPIHLCFVLTREYFGVSIKDLLFKKMAFPILSMVVVSIATVFVVSAW